LLKTNQENNSDRVQNLPETIKQNPKVYVILREVLFDCSKTEYKQRKTPKKVFFYIKISSLNFFDCYIIFFCPVLRFGEILPVSEVFTETLPNYISRICYYNKSMRINFLHLFPQIHRLTSCHHSKKHTLSFM